MPKILVTGGAGFIGSAFVRRLRHAGEFDVVTLDKLTYSGNLANLAMLADDPGHVFTRGDIADRILLRELFERHQPAAVVHFAAESHVDRSIHDPQPFVDTNVAGTTALLHETLAWWRGLEAPRRDNFRFVHISTDEVYGSLGPGDPPFIETTAYAPNSPYSASKAASDFFARAFYHTYGLPVIITNCSNNYGPYQFPEKLIPLVVLNAAAGEPLPVYGDGTNVRDWLHVDDHCAAVELAMRCGRPGQTYVIGGRAERRNIDIVNQVCALLDTLQPLNAPHANLIRFVTDRPGHDRRYAIDCMKMERELGWQRQHTFEQGLELTVRWYLDNPGWVEEVRSGAYRQWMDTNYAAREARKAP